MEPEVSMPFYKSPRLQEPATCPCPEPDKSRPYPNPAFWSSILILSSHLRLGLPNDLFSSGFPTTIPYAFLLSPIRATCPSYLILLSVITRIIFGEEYRSLSSSLCSFLHSPVTSSLLGPNIHLSAIFPNTLSLYSCLSVSDQVSHPYETVDKIIILYIPIFLFLDNWKKKDSAPNDSKHSVAYFFLNRILIREGCSKIFELFRPFKGIIFTLYIVTLFCIWSRDMTMYLVLSAFASSLISLLAKVKASVFFV